MEATRPESLSRQQRAWSLEAATQTSAYVRRFWRLISYRSCRVGADNKQSRLSFGVGSLPYFRSLPSLSFPCPVSSLALASCFCLYSPTLDAHPQHYNPLSQDSLGAHKHFPALSSIFRVTLFLCNVALPQPDLPLTISWYQIPSSALRFPGILQPNQNSHTNL
ncbi:hypothetical protein BT63DRAFT_260892 [Microthyrium microscopicum]|uniref:Uncharacterized protein n=1 Tax=Microthyrium microscopicum TaxID=703497 RepID=A0A6A6UB75_9PEZI|nr:hypothetical protein BT63DRAFT_260892 [Microthyrium microscopicum]